METIWALTITILATSTADNASLPGYISSVTDSHSTMYFETLEACEYGRKAAFDLKAFMLAGTDEDSTYDVSQCERLEYEQK